MPTPRAATGLAQTLYGRLADALEAATKDLHEVGRLAGQIMFDSDAEPARVAILDVTRKYGNPPILVPVVGSGETGRNTE